MRILLVEDNQRLQELVGRVLTADGFAVDVARRLGEAEGFLLAVEYNLIVLDLGLPDGDGLSFIKSLRARSFALPILVMTARDGLDDRIAGLDTGADDYLVKPFATEELAARCRALLRRPGGVLDNVLNIGNLSFDCNNRQAKIADRALSLPPRELSLLELLLRKAGHVVPRTQLENGLYAMGQEVSPNALEAAVSRLRRRLTASGANIILHTAHGLGYGLLSAGPGEMA